MAGPELPLGVRFKPSEAELVGYFLRARLDGEPLPPCYPQLMDFDVYTDHPFNILASTKERRGVPDNNGGGMAEGYFFSRLKKLSRNAKKKNNCRHIQGHGTWSEHSSTKDVLDENKRLIGIQKYFKFEPVAGRKNAAENEDEWQMYEFYLAGKDEMVLCHIYKKKESLASSRKRNRNNNAPPVKEAYYQGSTSKQSRGEYNSSPQFSSIVNIAARTDVKGKAITESNYEEGGTSNQGCLGYDYSQQFTNNSVIINHAQPSYVVNQAVDYGFENQQHMPLSLWDYGYGHEDANMPALSLPIDGASDNSFADFDFSSSITYDFDEADRSIMERILSAPFR